MIRGINFSKIGFAENHQGGPIELPYIQKLEQCFNTIITSRESSSWEYKKAMREYRYLASRLDGIKRRCFRLPVYPVMIQQFPPVWVLKCPPLLSIYYRLYLMPFSLLEAGLVFDAQELEKIVFRHMQSWQGSNPDGQQKESACYAGAVQLLDRCSRASDRLKMQILQAVERFCINAGCESVLERILNNYPTYRQAPVLFKPVTGSGDDNLLRIIDGQGGVE